MDQFESRGISQRESDQEEHNIQQNNRPSSVKSSDINQRKAGRPGSANPIKRFNNFMNNNNNNSNSNNNNNNNLVPIRKKKGFKYSVHYDKERLVDEAIQVKKQLNFMKEENLKLKTRINQMEKQLQKQEEIIENINKNQIESLSNNQFKKIYLEKSLKNTIKELKNELKQKQEDLEKIKKNMKQTRIQELEVEIQSYIAECTRLRHLLEETFRGRLGVMPNGNEEDAEALRERNYQQNQMIKNLRSQNQDIQNALKQKEDIIQENNKKLKNQELQQSKAARKQIKSKDQDIKRLKDKIQELEKQLEQQNKTIAQTQVKLQESKKKEEKSFQTKDLEDKNIKFQQNIQDLNSQIYSLKEQINKMQNKFQAEKQEQNQIIKDLELKNQDLHKQNQELAEKIKQKQDQIEFLQSQKVNDAQIKPEYKESAKQLVKQVKKQQTITQQEDSPLVEQASKSIIHSPVKRKPEDMLQQFHDYLEQQQISLKE